MSEAALAPKMGPVSEDERTELGKWNLSRNRFRPSGFADPKLIVSLLNRPSENFATVEYVIVRALRAGTPLEKLL